MKYLFVILVFNSILISSMFVCLSDSQLLMSLRNFAIKAKGFFQLVSEKDTIVMFPFLEASKATWKKKALWAELKKCRSWLDSNGLVIPKPKTSTWAQRIFPNPKTQKQKDFTISKPETERILDLTHELKKQS